MELITLSQHEFNRIEIVQRVIDQRMSQLDAAFHLKLSTRQVRRLINRFKCEGVTGLASKKRGKPSRRPFVVRVKSCHFRRQSVLV